MSLQGPTGPGEEQGLGVKLMPQSDVYLDVSLLVNQQVFRLQVSVDQVQSVQVLEGQDDLSCIKPSVRLAAHTGRAAG